VSDLIYVKDGGASLNFKVVGNPKPSDPKNNTIWIDTDVKIPEWGFASENPYTGNDVEEGTVWIQTVNKSPSVFNSLKKNGIMVYPVSAKQYVGGSWVEKEKEAYIDGAWKTWWNGELYDAGDEFEFITGGWQAFATSSNSPVKPTITKSSTSVNIKLSSPYNEGPYGGAYVTKNKISFKGKNTLKFTGDSSGENNGRCMICVWSSLVSGGSSPSVAQLFFPSGGMTNKTISLDIGSLNLTDSYYVGMYIYNAHWVTMKKMWLE
jgi:hypothetical protein